MKTMLKDMSKCLGCSACASVCALKAIRMEPNSRGFAVPVIDSDRCRDCGMCSAACPVLQENEKPAYAEKECIVAQNKNKEILMKSQSGGLFPAIAQTILEKGGVVYGAALENNIRVRHVRVDSVEALSALQGSKYIQSDVDGVFGDVLKDLKNGIPVLFTGTPCQCDGLKQFMKAKRADTEKLYLVDLICHGIPSPKLWRDYIAYLEKKHKAPVRKASFRDKTFGWASHYETFEFDGKKETAEVFKILYNTNACLRSSCYGCRYSSLKRVGDITIGDAWSTDRSKQYRPDSGGLSLVLLNTAKGRQLFDDLSDKVQFERKPLNEFMQPNLQHPTETIENVDSFWKDYDRFGFGYIRFVFGSRGLVNRIVKKLRRMFYSRCA